MESSIDGLVPIINGTYQAIWNGNEVVIINDRGKGIYSGKTIDAVKGKDVAAVVDVRDFKATVKTIGK